MKRVILSPNPYRDKHFQTLREALEVLKNAGVETRVCLPFEVDRSCELPRDIRFSRMDRELPNASMVICFGGDGTILSGGRLINFRSCLFRSNSMSAPPCRKLNLPSFANKIK